MTRAARALVHGDVATALAVHPLSVLVVPYIGVLAVVHLARYLRTGDTSRDGEDRLGRAITAAGAVLVAAMLVLWIARFFGLFGGPVPV